MRRWIYTICQHQELDIRAAAELDTVRLLATPDRPRYAMVASKIQRYSVSPDPLFFPVLVSTICRCIYTICQHPAVEAKVAAELDALGLLATPDRPQPRCMEHADLARLTYLQCIIKVRCPARPSCRYRMPAMTRG